MNSNKNKKCCGVGITMLFISDFIFTASCCKHDKYWLESKSFMDKILGDVFFWAYMIEDIVEGNYKFIKRWFYFVMATVYFITVSTIGIPVWFISKLLK